MAQAPTRTAIAFQGGGALGAFALGAMKYLYRSQPGFRPSCVSGVSIGAFTAAIVASHPDDPVPALEAFWKDITVFHSSLLPDLIERRLAVFGNRNFYWPRLDYALLPTWTSFYDLGPLSRTLSQYVDFGVIARGDVKLAVTATNIATGQIVPFNNSDPAKPLGMEHLIASGSLPPSYPPMPVDKGMFWDGGLFDNTPLSALFELIPAADAADTRIIVVNLFPSAGKIPSNMLEVGDRMTELHFANKTAKDLSLARKINKLVALVEELKPGALGGLSDLAKYKVFNNIIAVTNDAPEPYSSASDFSKCSIERRIEAGYATAEYALTHPPQDIAEFKAAAL